MIEQEKKTEKKKKKEKKEKKKKESAWILRVFMSEHFGENDRSADEKSQNLWRESQGEKRGKSGCWRGEVVGGVGGDEGKV